MRIHRFVMGMLTVCALLAFASCGTSPKAPPTAQQIFQRAQQSNMKDASLTLSGTGSGTLRGTPYTNTIQGTGQIVLKPAVAFHLAETVTQIYGQENGTITYDTIQVGGYIYERQQGQLPSAPIASSNLYYKFPAEPGTYELLPQSAPDSKIVGEETIRGDKCWHLTTTLYQNFLQTPVASTTPGAVPVMMDVWIRESDYYYVRVKQSTLPVVTTIDYSHYDTGVTISPPPASEIQ